MKGQIMTNGATIGMAGTTAGAAAETAKAIKASGAIVQVEAVEFLKMIERADKPLVVQAPAGFFMKYRYLTSYKGLVFLVQSADPLMPPAKAEIITAKRIWVPS
jgi:hypothetical protein